MYHLLRTMSEAPTTTFVMSGSSPPSWAKMFTKIGTRNRSIPIRTSVANASTMSGYMSAPLTRRLICVSFSIWKATRSRTMSRIPAASPASTIET